MDRFAVEVGVVWRVWPGRPLLAVTGWRECSNGFAMVAKGWELAAGQKAMRGAIFLGCLSR